ncbi:FecR family protein [Hanamia caeni]|uniref:FecR family protein n=1 Tax=Hanamia caeni TaxID=2294116 RepID=UPI001313FE9B|nr:FecR family protein [Hanamia caeni]
MSRLEYLFECYVNHKCSEEEEKELMALINDSRNEGEVKKLVEKAIRNSHAEAKMDENVSLSIVQKILESDKAKVILSEKNKFVLKPWIRFAAAVVLILIISGIFYGAENRTNNQKTTALLLPSKKAEAIVPGGNHARLIMADGTAIVLDSIQNGKIQQGSAIISKQNGMLVYDGKMHANGAMPVTYNTLTTPRGGQYQVVLPDGSKVWLNASSSLRFPTAFIGKERNVELTGEAYFEVAKNKEKPFHVNVNGMQVEVLGTHFNINAYADENSIKTSLLEGSVKIKRGSVSGLLKPGQQGILDDNNNDLKINRADMDEVVAWKNGLFQFDGANIKTIMLEISRWYNMEIVYEGNVPERSFVGKISRDAQLSDVLKILELSSVKFKVEGRKIIVQ